MTFTAVVVEASKGGDLAFSRGACEVAITDAKSKKPVTEKCKYATVYRKQADDSWKAILSLVNAEAPGK